MAYADCLRGCVCVLQTDIEWFKRKGLWIISPTVLFTQSASQIAFLCDGTVGYLLGTSLEWPRWCSMAGYCNVFTHGVLSFLLTFLPYIAISAVMPAEKDVIATLSLASASLFRGRATAGRPPA